MKNYAMPAAIATVGLGLLSIGFNLNGNQANATPAAFNAGPVEPTIVWYESHYPTTDPTKAIKYPTFWFEHGQMALWKESAVTSISILTADATVFSFRDRNAKV